MAEQVERLNKYLAECGICSRREADRFISEGRVSVNGIVAVMGTKVSENDKITLNGKSVEGKNKKVVLAYYKPVGVTCTEKDKYAKKKINDVLKYPVRLTYAGRLDKDSEGLLVMTNDGELIDSMMRGANKHDKEYIVKVDKEITKEFLKNMADGIYIKDLDITTRPCKVSIIGKFTFNIILTQGVNRQIRRMAKCLGYEVKALKRVRIMNVNLANLKSGEFRTIEGEELAELYGKCGLKVQSS